MEEAIANCVLPKTKALYYSTLLAKLTTGRGAGCVWLSSFTWLFFSRNLFSILFSLLSQMSTALETSKVKEARKREEEEFIIGVFFSSCS